MKRIIIYFSHVYYFGLTTFAQDEQTFHFGT